MQKFVRFATKRPLVTRVHAFHTSRVSAAISKFNLPAMSPTMTEGTIHKWKVKEGESFSAGDVLLELETDKAQIDVEAQDDGILAKILLQDGEKAPVNTPIALLAEEGDDISNIEIPADEPAADEPAKTQEEATKPAEASSPAKSAPIPTKPMDHHDIDTSALKKPLSPAVLNLVLRHHIKDLGAIKASGPGGRILKGDVLAHLGFIPYKPAPPMRTSAAPPRDQIVFAKSAAEKEPAKEKPVLPNFISKTIVVDDLFALRQALNEQHSTSVSVNDFIAKAATRALQDVTKPTMASTSSSSPVKFATDAASFSESYKGGSFKIFHLAPPTYDFITDSYEPPKPYELVVSASKPVASSAPSKSADEEMVDLIGYLGGEEPAQTAQSIKLTTQDARINFADLPRQARLQVELKLKDDKPGKILNDPKAASFLERVEYYVRNPSELTV